MITIKNRKVYSNKSMIGCEWMPNLKTDMNLWTYYLVYEEDGEEMIEEIDIYAYHGWENEVAKIVAKQSYNPGYKLMSMDDYNYAHSNSY